MPLIWDLLGLCVCSCYLCNAFSIFAGAFHRSVGKMFFKQKIELEGTLGVVSSPNSSAVCGRFILQGLYMLTHLTASLDCLESLKRVTGRFKDRERLREVF